MFGLLNSLACLKYVMSDIPQAAERKLEKENPARAVVLKLWFATYRRVPQEGLVGCVMKAKKKDKYNIVLKAAGAMQLPYPNEGTKLDG